MKVVIVQPYYSMDCKDADECFAGLISLMEKCSDKADVIVLPEYCDTPTAYKTKAEFDAFIDKYNYTVMRVAVQTAIRCKALVFINAVYKTEKGYRNTTYAIDESGTVVDKYFKAHPAPSEVRKVQEGGHAFDVSYSYLFDEPHVFEYKGVRYGFMTCYDFYFYESFASLARKNVDVIIGASHQRTDTHQALEIIGRFLCYNTNAYLVRASVSLGENSGIGGSSMVIAPDGTMLANMKSQVGICACEIDPTKKYLKPAGFGGKTKSHYEYIEEGRRPWNYRPGGSAICLPQDIMPYPRACAYGGYNALLPENSMPAFGAAVASGADEIAFDLCLTEEKKPVCDKTLLADILQKFSCHTVMNMHIKPSSAEECCCEDMIKEIARLIECYDCEKYVYFTLESEACIKQFTAYLPHIPVCIGCLGDRPDEIVDRAIELGAEKVQLRKPYIHQEMIDKAHAHGIRCSVFSDDEKEVQHFLEMGIDTILTKDFAKISSVIKNR